MWQSVQHEKPFAQSLGQCSQAKRPSVQTDSVLDVRPVRQKVPAENGRDQAQARRAQVHHRRRAVKVGVARIEV